MNKWDEAAGTPPDCTDADLVPLRIQKQVRAAEREIAEWLIRRDGTDDPDEWQERKGLADAILRGEYKEGKSDE